MSIKKKKGSAKGRRSALKSFASKAAKFQSPVHSNGFKQDVLIDLYGGDRGHKTGGGQTEAQVAKAADLAGKSHFLWDGRMKRVVKTKAAPPKGKGKVPSKGESYTYSTAVDIRVGKAK